MDRHTCSFMSGPGRAPLGSNVKIRGKKGEEKRGEEANTKTWHYLYCIPFIYLFDWYANLTLTFEMLVKKKPDYLPHKSMPPRTLDRQNYLEIISNWSITEAHKQAVRSYDNEYLTGDVSNINFWAQNFVSNQQWIFKHPNSRIKTKQTPIPMVDYLCTAPSQLRKVTF